MGKAGTVLAFAMATAVALLGFGPFGRALAEVARDIYWSMTAGGSAETTAALVPLLGADAILILGVLAISFLGGARLPSGLPHVFFALFVPFALGAMQQRFFELAGDVNGLAERFGAANFIAAFLLSIIAAQLGVHLSRWRLEAREDALATEV